MSKPVVFRSIGCVSAAERDALVASLNADAEVRPYSWVQLARVGTYRGHSYGQFTFDPTAFRKIEENFAKLENKKIPLDFEHASEAGSADGVSKYGAPAQGWIRALRSTNEMLEGHVEWLPGQPGVGYVKTGAYEFLSPAVVFDSVDRVTGKAIGPELVSAGLTNRPFLDGMRPVTASARDARVTTTLSQSFERIRNELSEAICKAFGWCSEVKHVFDGYVIFEANERIWRSDYAIEGTLVHLSGEPVEVDVAYVPIDGGAVMSTKLMSALGASDEVAALSAVDGIKAKAASFSAVCSALNLSDVASVGEVAKQVAALQAKAAKLDVLEPEVLTLRARIEADAEAQGEAEIDFVIANGGAYGEAYRFPETARKSLRLSRKADPKDFAETFKVPLDGMKAGDRASLFTRVIPLQTTKEAARGTVALSADDALEAHAKSFMETAKLQGRSLTFGEAIAIAAKSF
jgi:hypothetical protein